MTAEEAAALMTGELIEYWDGRIALVKGNEPAKEEVAITFDEVSTSYIKYDDFLRASVKTPQIDFKAQLAKNQAIVQQKMAISQPLPSIESLAAPSG